MSNRKEETGAFVINDNPFDTKTELEEDIEFLREKLKGKMDTGVLEF